MRESRTFGSVGGEGGNVLAYPAQVAIARRRNGIATDKRKSGVFWRTSHASRRLSPLMKKQEFSQECSARVADLGADPRS
jgi:hypothetical protein